jgi:hypothetical protein
MDLYVKNENAFWRLHEEIVSDIRIVLKEKGYTSGRVTHNDEFEIFPDRIIINGWHTDHITVDNLLKHLHDAYLVLPKFN